MGLTDLGNREILAVPGVPWCKPGHVKMLDFLNEFNRLFTLYNKWRLLRLRLLQACTGQAGTESKIMAETRLKGPDVR